MKAPTLDHGTSPQHQFSKKGWSQHSDSVLKVCDESLPTNTNSWKKVWSGHHRQFSYFYLQVKKLSQSLNWSVQGRITSLILQIR